MVIGDMPPPLVGSRCPRGPFCIPFRTSSKPMVVSIGHQHRDAVSVAGSVAREARDDDFAGTSLSGTLFVFGCAEAGRGGVLLAHVGAVLGFSVPRAVTVVIDLGIRVGPNHGV